jgi:hypothetical protein
MNFKIGDFVSVKEPFKNTLPDMYEILDINEELQFVLIKIMDALDGTSNPIVTAIDFKYVEAN